MSALSFAGVFGLDLALGVLVLGVTTAAAQGVWSAPPGRTARRTVPLLLAALVLLAGRAATGLALASFDASFARRRLLFELPLVAVPLLLTLVGAGRRTHRPVAGSSAAAAASGVVLLDLLVVPGTVVTACLVLLALAGPALVLGRRGSPWLRGSLLAVPALVLVLAVGAAWWTSRVPDTFDMGAYAAADLGGGPGAVQASHAGHGGHSGTSVADLTGPQDAAPDARFVLTAARLAVGDREALAFNGSVPGPAIEATEGDLVEVVLRNADVEDGVSVHWHGVDVPNAEDGVAGVTQDAVAPGGSHTYRFVAERPGSYWYHSHQQSSEQVARGLYGALIVSPARPTGAAALDMVAVDHAWRGPQGFVAGSRYDEGQRLERVAVEPGTTVRLRLVNTDNTPRRYRVDGAAYRLVAVDGTDLAGPGQVTGRDLRLGGGGRYDLLLTVADGPVTVHGLGAGHRLVLGQGPAAPPAAEQPLLDLAAYGTPAPTPFDTGSAFDRDFVLDIDRRVRFQEGRLGWQWTVNDESFPRMPMLVVREGDLVRTTIVNRSTATHPMHLHGHHVLVLERDGEPVTGSPWWSDTLDVAPGERYVVAFRADNPGIWMDHCHDLGHAAAGFVLHLAYEGVRTPFTLGGPARNAPE